MTSRVRPRTGPIRDDPNDAGEERKMWNEIIAGLKQLKDVNAKAKEVSEQIVELEAKIGPDGNASVAEIDALQALYRKGVALSEEEQELLASQPRGVIESVGLLCAMRAANEAEAPRAVKSGPRDKPSRNRSINSEILDAPPSPSVSSANPHGRIRKENGRGGSMPATPKDTKDVTVKSEDTGTAPVVDTVKPTVAEKPSNLSKDQEVAFKTPKKGNEGGDWIKCIIVEVLSEGTKKRYRVQDPEPDDHGATTGLVYFATAAQLIPIPPEGSILPDYPRKKMVLALYPDTTTFYKAEVMSSSKGVVRLVFEGEDEVGKETEVVRRHVLDAGNR